MAKRTASSILPPVQAEFATNEKFGGFRIMIDPKSIDNVIEQLGGRKRDIKRVIVGALNDAVKVVERESVDRVFKRLNVRKTDIRRGTRIRRANQWFPSATFTFKKTVRLPLKRFGARQVGGTGQWGAERRKRDEAALLKDTARLVRGRLYAGPNPKAGVTYKIERGGKRSFIPQAFIIERFGSHVFKRRGKERLPIFRPMGPSPWGVFVKNKMAGPVVEIGRTEMNKLLDRRLKFILKLKSGEIANVGNRGGGN